jgi:hypothetical protein
MRRSGLSSSDDTPGELSLFLSLFLSFASHRIASSLCVVAVPSYMLVSSSLLPPRVSKNRLQFPLYLLQSSSSLDNQCLAICVLTQNSDKEFLIKRSVWMRALLLERSSFQFLRSSSWPVLFVGFALQQTELLFPVKRKRKRLPTRCLCVLLLRFPWFLARVSCLGTFALSLKSDCRLQFCRCRCCRLLTKMPKLMKFSLRSLTTLFSRHKHCKGMMPVRAAEMSSESVVAKELSVDTELPVIDRENQHHLSSYTSLRDLMPTSSRPISPIKHKRESLTGEREQEEEDFHSWPGGTRPPIKNHLVEQAARAYLLPAGTQRPPSNQFFACYWAKLTSSGSLHGGYCRNDDLYAAHVHGSGHLDGCSDCGSFSCLPSFLWLDLTRIFRCLFRNVRPQPVGFLRT